MTSKKQFNFDTDPESVKKVHRKKRRKRRQMDSAWKEIIENFFEDVMKLLFPNFHAIIDFSKKYEFLSIAMRPIAPFGDHGDREADVLVKVQLKDKLYTIIRIIIHIEVQCEPQEKLMERIYIYNYRSFDKRLESGIPVISLLILADDDDNFRPDKYEVTFADFSLSMKVPMVKLIDFKLKPEMQDRLEASDSPIAVVIKTQLRSMELKRADDHTKLVATKQLMRECYRAGHSKNIIHKMIKFLVRVIMPSKEYNKELTEEIKKIEEEYTMNFLLPWEATAEKRGRKKGRQEEKKETAVRMLKDGFSKEKIAQYTGLSEKEIEKLL